MADTKSEDAKTAALRRKIEYRVACEERAHHIVERLIENPVEEEALINSVCFSWYNILVYLKYYFLF